MTMLPDIDQQSWDDYQRKQFEEDSQRQLDALTFNQSAQAQIASLPSSDALTNPLGTGNAMAQPAPAAPPEPPSVQPATPVQSPAPSTEQDWIGHAIGAVQRAGGDVDTFAQALNSGTGDVVGRALGAAQRAGADMQTFAGSLPAMPTQAQPPAAVPSAAAAPEVARGGDLRAYARQAASRAGIDPDIFERQIQQESGFNPGAKSGAGALGIAQFMPATAAGMGVDPNDPYAALDAAARLDAQNLQRFGSVDKMLAAYNAGPGAVERYGGVPPYAETQDYVRRITTGGIPILGGLQQAGSAIAGKAGEIWSDISQFGDKQLTADEAYAACGPAAAVRFAQRFGRNPTLREATDLARTVGWTPAQGMAGIDSQQQLMSKLGIPTQLVRGPQWQQFAAEAQTGNPVTISTQGHYFFADGYDQNTGAFHVGRSGTDLRGGSEWMTPAQMTTIMGPVQGGLLADNPQVPAPSTADQSTSPLDYLSRLGDSIGKSFSDLGTAVSERTQPLTDLYGNLTEAATGVGRFLGGPSDEERRRAFEESPALQERANQLAPPPAQPPERATLQDYLGTETGRAALGDQLGRYVQDIGGLGGVLGGLAGVGGASSGVSMTLPEYQQLQDWRRKQIEELNPVRDVPVLGGAVNMAADIVTSPETYLLGGPIGRASEVAAEIAPAALRTAARLGTEGALWGGEYGLTEPGATPQSVATMAGGGALLAGAGAAVGALRRRLGSNLFAVPPAAQGTEQAAEYGLGEIRGEVADRVKAAMDAAPTPQELADATATLQQFTDRSGKVVGVPAQYATPEGLAQLRARVRTLAELGESQKDWYIDSSKAIMDATQGDKAEAEKLAQLIAIYSGNTPVSQNMNHALTAYYQAKAGLPIDAPTLSAANERARQLLYDNVPWEGRKTNNFYRNLMQQIDPEVYAQLGKETGQSGVTVDTWMMRAFDYLAGATKDGRKYLKAPSGRQYDFIQNEVERVAKEMGWKPEQAQAAIWASTQASAQGKAVGQTYYHYGTALAERMGQASWETSPGRTALQQVRGYATATPEQRQTYHEAVSRAFQDEQGRDILARSLGLVGGNTFDAPGVYQGAVTPGAQTRFALPQARQSRGGQPLPEMVGKIEPAAREAINAYAAARGLLLKQDAVPWTRIFQAPTKAAANAVDVNIGRTFTPEEAAQLDQALANMVGADKYAIVSAPEGVWIHNFTDAPTTAFKKAVDRALTGLESKATARTKEVLADSEYIANDWSANPNGESYLSTLEQSGRADAFRNVADSLAGRIRAAQEGITGGWQAATRGGGALAGIVERAPGGAALAARLGRGAVGGGIAGGYAAAQQPEATPQSVALGVLGGAAGGALRAGLPGGRQGATLARAVEERSGGLSDEAQRLLATVDAGGVPGFMTASLRRIASEHGIPVEAGTTPNDVIQGLRALRNGAAAEAPLGRVAEVARMSDEDVARLARAQEQARAAGMVPPEVRTPKQPEGGREIQLTPWEETARLRLEDFPLDVRRTIAEHANGIDWARTQRRGVIPDAVAEQMAQDYAGNTSLDNLIRSGGSLKAYTTEQIRAIRNATAAQAVTLNDAARAITQGDTSDAALRDWFVQGEKLDRLIQIGEGARAEAGRSLRAYQDPASLVNLKPEDAITKITQYLGTDKTRLLDAIQNYQALVDQGASPVQLAAFWSGLKSPVTALDWFKLLRYNSMLSGPRTIEVNAIGSALEMPWRLARDVGASAIRGRPEEIGVEAAGAWAGLDLANRRFMEMLTQGITAEAAARGDLPRSISARLGPSSHIGRPVAQVLESTGRFMAATDEWMKTIAYGMALGRQSARQASREGLEGQAWRTRVAQILADPATSPQIMKDADAMADRMVFHGDMGDLGTGLERLNQKAGLVGNLFLPFLRTTYHITARGIDRSPLGIIGTGIDVARGKYGKSLPELRQALSAGVGPDKGVAPLGERLGDNLMGSMAFLALYNQALNDNISASGPSEPQRRELLRSEGWQPYSIRVGNNWISYANWGPAAIPFAMAAAAAETQRYAKPGASPGDLILDGISRTAQIATEQTYLQSIGAAWKGMTDPARYGYQWVNQTITSLIPFGSTINTVAQAMDPYSRRPDRWDIGDVVRQRLPSGTPLIGGRSEVPEAQDVLGRPAPNVRAGGQALNPLLVSPERADPVLKEFDDRGYAPPAAPTTVTRGNNTIQLQPEEQRQVQAKAGELIADRVGIEINAPSYRALTDEAKKKRLEMIVSLAREQASNEFLRGLSDTEFQKRVDEARARRVPVPVSGR